LAKDFEIDSAISFPVVPLGYSRCAPSGKVMTILSACAAGEDVMIAYPSSFNYNLYSYIIML
jgi:hypothetical protein